VALILAYAAAAFSLIAAGFAILIFTRLAGNVKSNAAPSDTVADAIRTEADRIRLDAGEQARGTRQELGDSIRGFQDSFAQRMDAGIERLQVPITSIGQKLDQDIAKMGSEASTNRDALKLSIETKLDASDTRSANAGRELREELIGNFTKTSDVLSRNMQLFGEHQHQRLELIKQELGAMTEKQSVTHESLRQTIESRLDAIRQENALKLDEMRQTVDEKLQTTLEKRLGDSFKTVQEQLERVHSGLGEMQSLAIGVGDLKRVLTNVKTRGTWAEVQLGLLLEQFLSPDQYIRNAQIKPGSAERVEYAIKFTGRDGDDDLLLPIDAKFPIEDYERLAHAAEAADSAGVEDAASALEARIRSSAKSISEKYISPPYSTDFAILYLPTETLFAEIIRRPGVCEQLQRDFRVVLAGPTTLSSLLSAFQMGFRSQAIQKRSSEVWKILGAVRAEFSEHGKVVAKLQKQLGAATNTIEALGTRTKAMNRKLKDVETLPAADVQTVLGLSAAVLAAAEDEEDLENIEQA
jgi:DNA recombination protein RmuC